MESLNNYLPMPAHVTSSEVTIIQWLKYYDEQNRIRGKSPSSHWIADVISSLNDYSETLASSTCRPQTSVNPTLANLTRDYLSGFVKYLMTTPTRRGTLPAKATVTNKLKCIRAALNMAIDEELLHDNPATRIKATSIGGRVSMREYLTIEEVKRLVATPCRCKILKHAFLFSCFCGLRISDIRALKWKNIVVDGARMRLEIAQHKTGEALYLPLNAQAAKWLPQRPANASSQDLVFNDLPKDPSRLLGEWAAAANIEKHVTYHVSRHTFATMELTMGADLYTTSKLLGHTSVTHTQIYAKIINSKKDEAVALLDKAFDE